MAGGGKGLLLHCQIYTHMQPPHARDKAYMQMEACSQANPQDIHVLKPSLSHQYCPPTTTTTTPHSTLSSLRQTEIAVHTQPSTTSQSY